jgi:hypothetical protein
MYLKNLRYEAIQFKTLRTNAFNLALEKQNIAGTVDPMFKTKMKKISESSDSIMFACKDQNLKIEYTNPKKGFIYSDDIPVINCIRSFNCNFEFMK